MSAIEITAEPPKPISVTLLGVDYKVRPLKGSLGVAMAQRFSGKNLTPEKIGKEMDTLIRTMFGPDDAPKIQKRLIDPDDLLDYEHIIALMNKVVEAQSGNPTTS